MKERLHRKFARLSCSVLFKSVLLISCVVWIFFQNAGSQLCFRFFFFYTQINKMLTGCTIVVHNQAMRTAERVVSKCMALIHFTALNVFSPCSSPSCECTSLCRLSPIRAREKGQAQRCLTRPDNGFVVAALSGGCSWKGGGLMSGHLKARVLTYPLSARVVGAPHIILQPVSSIFPSFPLPSGTWRTPGLPIPRCCLPTSSSVC